MVLKLYNTMSRKKEEFRPIEKGKAGVYSCGPTVYSYAHLGHFRAYIFVDTLRRVLGFNDFKVKHVMNVTDVGHLTSQADTGEDKVEMAARREGKSAWEIAEFYTKDFFEAMKKLNVLTPGIVCKATNHIKEMVGLVQRIANNGYAYIISDGIYFDTLKLPDYGKLARLDIKGLKAGARVEISPEKRNPTDFALWKFSPLRQKRQMEWDNELEFTLDKNELNLVCKIVEKNSNIKILEKNRVGDKLKLKIKILGFPGWHIECTAMAMKYLGETYDIHTGGVDHIPVHHTNEIAQAEAATGKEFVRYWVHNEFLQVEGQKMSKSLENFYNMKDIEERGFDPLALRYLFLTAHYRSKMNFTWRALKAAEKALSTLRGYIRLLQKLDKKTSDPVKIQRYKKRFLDYVSDDLNTPEALSVVWKLLRDEQKISNKDKYELLLSFDEILGLRLGKIKLKEELPEEAKKLIKEREDARKRNDWKRADEIRKELLEIGIIIEDTPEGVRWRIK